MNRFITFEGGEGSGKSTQIKIISELLILAGNKVTITREPGGPRIAEEIRKIILKSDNNDLDKLSEAYLFAASRTENVKKIIIPSLNDNNFVLCDRYVDSSIVYQGYITEIGNEKIKEINKFAIENAIPEITFIFDIDPVKSISRLDKRSNNNRYDEKDLDFHTNIRRGYQELAKDDKRYIIINANKSLDEVTKSIWSVIKERYGIK